MKKLMYKLQFYKKIWQNGGGGDRGVPLDPRVDAIWLEYAS